jgi:putative polyhydroxyalkanoate system protein
MAEIKVRRPHKLPLKEARRIAQKAADDLAEKYDLTSAWEGDRLHFRRSGVEGHMHVSETEISLTVRLGILLRPFRAAFESHIERNLDEQLEGAATAKLPAKAAKAPAKAAKKSAATRKT